jgi:multiple RNA-binding domain-containing protein 1
LKGTPPAFPRDLNEILGSKFLPKDVDMSTRIIIKNLPHNITPTRLKSHFSISQSGNTVFSGTVTDAKLVIDVKSGKSRGFAFVGYRTVEEATKAVEWYNGTFVDMRKISVEIAKQVFPRGG